MGGRDEESLPAELSLPRLVVVFFHNLRLSGADQVCALVPYRLLGNTWPDVSPFLPSCSAVLFTCRYSPSMKSLSNKFMHLTNYSVNKKNTEYQANADETSCQGHKWYREQREPGKGFAFGGLGQLSISTEFGGDVVLVTS